MTVSYDPRSSHAADDAEGGTEASCQACGHQRMHHDTTSTRFCRATMDRALDRGCLCSPDGPRATPMYGRGRYSGR